MIHINYITAKGMPAAQAAAGQHAPMWMAVWVSLGNTVGSLSGELRRELQRMAFGFAAVCSEMFGASKSISFTHASVSNGSNPNGTYATTGAMAYANPPHRDDNSPGKARRKLR